MPLSVDQVQDAASRHGFSRLQRALERCDPLCIPSDPGVPPHGTSFLAREDAEPVARCCARLQTDNPHVGTIGAFAAREHLAAAQAVLQAAVEHLRGQGARRIIGPMDGDTWHHYRLNTGPYAAAPFIKEPWNPPYYPALWEGAGFSVAETYESYIIDAPDLAAAKQRKYFDRCRRNGYRFTPITAATFEQMIPLVHELSCQIFSGNMLYTRVELEAFKRLYLPAKALMRDGLSWLAHAADGTPAGYVFTFPDYAGALRAMRGQAHPLARLRFLLRKRDATRTCIKTLGVVPSRRGSGLTAALMHLAYQHTVTCGYTQTLMCLMHSANDSRRFGGGADRPFRSYALYEYAP